MRKCAGLLAVLAIVACSPPNTTNAEPVDPVAGVWTHPDGLYTLRPADGGWVPWTQPPSSPELDQALDALQGSAEPDVATFELAGESQVVRMCFVRGRRLPLPHRMSQAELNDRTPGFAPRMDDGVVANVRTLMVDGVAVAAFRMEQGPQILHYRIFALADAEGATYNELSCGGPQPVSQAHERAFTSFLDSLRISRSRATQ